MEKKHHKRIPGFRFNSLLVQMAGVLSVLLLLILCVVYLMFNRFYVREYRENRFYFNQMAAETVRDTALEQIGRLEWSISRFFEDQDVNHYVAAGSGFTDSELIEVSLKLKQWAAGEPLVEDASLLVYRSGKVLRSDQVVEEWTDAAHGNIFPEAGKRVAGTPVVEGADLRYSAGFPEELPAAVLSVCIDRAALYELVKERMNTSSAWPLYIYDKNRQPVFDDLLTYPAFESDELQAEQETDSYACYRLKEDPDQLVMRNYAGKLGWFFISLTDEKEVTPPGQQVLKNIFPLLMVLLVLIGATSLLLVLRVYPPLMRLLETVDTRLRGKTEEWKTTGNELDYIRLAVEQAGREREQLQKLVEVSEEEIAEKLIGMAAGKKAENRETWLSALEHMQHPFTEPGKYVLLLYRCQPLVPEAESASPLPSLDIYEARTRVAEFWSGRCSYQPFPVDEYTRAMVLKYPEQTLPSHIRQDLTLFEKTMKEQKWETSRLAWGWGEPVSGLSLIHTCFKDAEPALERCMYYAEQSGEGNTGEDEEMVHFSRIYSECLNRMMLGEAEGKEGLDQLLTEVFQLPEDRRPVLYRVLYNRTAERLVALQLETGQMEEVPSPQSVTGENSEEALRQLFARSSRILKDSGKKEQYRFVESAREYIHAHYADSMLSLDVVSGHLGISSPYLSGLMSRYLSMGFVEYISRYRLEQAKRLMEISDISIQEIGRKTGFNSPQSFGRVFKKYNGETPGRYREKVLRKKDGEGGKAGK